MSPLTIVIAAGVVPALAFAEVYEHAIDLPFWDEWNYAPLVFAAHGGTVPWSGAWAQHNEHRTFFMALLMLGLSRLGGWSALRETLFGVGLLTVNLSILWRIVVTSIPRVAVPYVFLGASLLTFSLVQFETLFWGMGLGWFLANGCSLFVFYQLTRPKFQQGHVVLGLIAAAVASYSLAAGIMTLPVGLLILLFRRPLDGRSIAVWLAGMGTILWGFFFRYDRTPSFPLNAHDFETVYPQYVLTYLGAPLGSSQGSQISVALGLVALAIVLIATVRAVAIRRRTSSALRYFPWLALCAFVIVNALLTGYGRAATGVGQASSSRYTTIGTDLWIGVLALVVLLTYDALQSGRIGRRAPFIWSVAGVAGFAYLIQAAQVAGFAAMSAYTGQISSAMVALHNSSNPTDAQMRLLYPDAAYVRARLAEIAAVDDSQFGSFW